MTRDDIRQCAAFSNLKLSELQDHVERTTSREAFCWLCSATDLGGSVTIALNITNLGFSDNHAKWIADFRKKNGRAPRVPSIGNIANNA